MKVRYTRRLVLGALAALSAGMTLAQDAAPFPSKPVRFVVPYAAGGPVDGLVRALARALQDEWKQPVIVDNKPGANEIIAAETVAKAPGDGYTLLAATESALTMNQHLYTKLPYSPTVDLVPVTRLVEVPLAIAVPTSLPANDIKEFIELARKSPTPLAYGSGGAGGISHLPMAMLAKNEGITLNQVPYKGAAPTIPDLIANIVQASALAVPVIEPHVKAGTMKAVVVSAPRRLVALPNVPTFEESGVKDIQARFNIGVAAPKGTPPAITARIAADARRILNQPDFRARNVDPFSYVLHGSSPAEYAAFLEQDRVRQAERVKVSGAVLN
ncbi:tripartite-type tricarboxylate transporter receptor subunit TctC [Variovorax beijingensis]|uniref:Tripartite-type tricarboxylate transporter receptor subunit TctC n=1 Tax=Variovorax beijingensis TaxID=2496117 RepID=A0A561BDA2_9BURK|nr:tripartite tricarboxylate transporter substrate binding protein [Variovorax beijingensis]TWD76886.1 tripartite-type tricarboxylate transporter receptor subunit TctC [Variovorax beijingensis]